MTVARLLQVSVLTGLLLTQAAFAEDRYVIVDSVSTAASSQEIFSVNLTAAEDASDATASADPSVSRKFNGFVTSVGDSFTRPMTVTVPGADELESYTLSDKVVLPLAESQDINVTLIQSWTDDNLERFLVSAQPQDNDSAFQSVMTVTNDPIPAIIVPAVIAGAVVLICSIDRINVYMKECEQPDFAISLKDGFTCSAKCL